MFESYKDKICVVTGGAGFIGTHLCNALSNLGAFVTIIDNKTKERKLDVRDASLVNKYIDGSDYVFHLAALTEVINSFNHPYDYFETNVLGTLNVLESCRKNKINSIVIASTDKVYGDSFSRAYEQVRLERTIDPYSNSKRLMDELCTTYRNTYNMPIKILRSVNTYGPGQRNDTTLITRTINRLLLGQCAKIYRGSLDSSREWMYIDDAVNAYLFAGLLNSQLTMNIGTQQVKKVRDIVTKIGNILNVTRQMEIDETQISTRVSSEQSVDCSLLFRMYPNWKPVELDDGLKQTINWHKECWSNPL